MKTWKIFWGCLLVFLALFLLLDSVGVLVPVEGVFGEVSFFRLAAGLLLFSGIVSLLSKWNWQEIFVPLALLFMLFEKNIAVLIGSQKSDLINNWMLFGCSLLLTAGLLILFPKRRRKSRFRRNSKNNHFNNLGSGTRYIDCTHFRHELVENNLGSYEVRFDNAAAYNGGATLEVENNLGSMDIYAPKEWNVTVRVDSSMGSVTKVGLCTQNGPDLLIMGDCNLGTITVYFV